MKEVIKKHLPNVSGGMYEPKPEHHPCIPEPPDPTHIDWGYPQMPLVDAPDVGV